MLKIVENNNVIIMEFSIMENVPTPCGSMFNLFRGSQLNYRETYSFCLPDFPVFSYINSRSTTLGGWLV